MDATSSRFTASSRHGVARTAEVVVIGRGVVGAATAFQLARGGVRGVVLLERRQLGAGATGTSGALIRCHRVNLPEARLTLESLRIFRAWEDEVGAGSPGFEPVGFVQVVAPADEPSLRANVAARQAIGVETSVLTTAELREIEPLLRTDDLSVAAFAPHSGFAGPNATLYGFAAAAAARGATILTDTPATANLVEGGHVAGVATAAGTISTSTVLPAAGAWADRLLDPLRRAPPLARRARLRRQTPADDLAPSQQDERRQDNRGVAATVGHAQAVPVGAVREPPGS